MTTMTAHAQLLGATAFHAGLKCVPALDNTLREHIQSVEKLGESVLAQLDAWLRGWTIENLKPESEWVERNSS